jgi:hypothetical protein
MEHDVEEELWFFYPEQRLEKDEMARTADGQEFRQPLDNTKKNCLKDIDLDSLFLLILPIEQVIVSEYHLSLKPGLSPGQAWFRISNKETLNRPMKPVQGMVQGDVQTLISIVLIFFIRYPACKSGVTYSWMVFISFYAMRYALCLSAVQVLWQAGAMPSHFKEETASFTFPSTRAFIS